MIFQAVFRVEAVCNLTIICEFFDCVLRIVVVPGHAVMIQEREELMPILLRTLLVRLGAPGTDKSC